MSARALIQDLAREGVTISLVAAGQIAVDGPRAALDRWLPEIREAKPELLALLTRAASDPAHHHRSLVAQPDGEVFSLSRTPPATLAEIQADYPGAQVEPELPPGPAPHPEDLALADAYLRHIRETDQAIGTEYLAGLAADPERLRQMYAEAVRLGLATFDPQPEAIAAPATGAVCARCRRWTPSPINPAGGLGRCLTDAPASRKAGACWPWPDAEVSCGEFEPIASAPEAANHDARSTIQPRPTTS